MQEIHKTPGGRKVEIPISEKYMLTINEAASHFSIGVKKLRRMSGRRWRSLNGEGAVLQKMFRAI